MGRQGWCLVTKSRNLILHFTNHTAKKFVFTILGNTGSNSYKRNYYKVVNVETEKTEKTSNHVLYNSVLGKISV